jgi:hypothetical protein
MGAVIMYPPSTPFAWDVQASSDVRDRRRAGPPLACLWHLKRLFILVVSAIVRAVRGSHDERPVKKYLKNTDLWESPCIVYMSALLHIRDQVMQNIIIYNVK